MFKDLTFGDKSKTLKTWGSCFESFILNAQVKSLFSQPLLLNGVQEATPQQLKRNHRIMKEQKMIDFCSFLWKIGYLFPECLHIIEIETNDCSKNIKYDETQIGIIK
ncbi:hypothetical protein ACGWY2_002241 [Enterococcus hirae]